MRHCSLGGETFRQALKSFKLIIKQIVHEDNTAQASWINYQNSKQKISMQIF